MEFKPTQILKDLNLVLKEAKKRFPDECIMPDIILSDKFKEAYSNYLLTKGYSARFYDYTTIITNKFSQHTYVANQWFVIASYFVDFCSEMLSYREIFVELCHRMDLNSTQMKEYATYLRSAPTMKDKEIFISCAIEYLQEEFGSIEDDYVKVANYLWKFVSDYKWWAGNKTIDRHDFYVSALLNQMNVVNANSEYLGIITLSYANNLDLRILIDDITNISLGVEVVNTPKIDIERRKKVDVREHEYEAPLLTINKGISISAASLERFKGNRL